MPYLCSKCLKDRALLKVVALRGMGVDLCEVCGATNVVALSSEDAELKSKVRSLIRFHYSEWHYNTHLGGDGLESLFYAKNPITNYYDGWNDEKYEESVLEFIEPAYEKYDEGISLFSGYDEDGQQNPPLVALKNEDSAYLLSLKRKSDSENYFLVEQTAAAILSPGIPNIEGKLDAGVRLFRTRIGYDARATPLMGWGDERHYRPFVESDLSSPPPVVASGGRMNRQGVAFLYMATDSDTAIAETRPHPGHFCSVGEFEASRALRVADLSAIEVTDFASSDKRLDEFLLLKTLDGLFSMPVTPEGRSSYHFTQLLADCIRQLGFDAVRYRSSVGKGSNVVVFDPSVFAFVPGSARVVKISALSYEYTAMQPMGDESEYLTRPDGTLV